LVSTAWDRSTTAAMVWCRAILAIRGLAPGPDPSSWAAAVADARTTRRGLERNRLIGAAASSAALIPDPGVVLSSWLRTYARQGALLSLAHAATASRIREALSSRGIPALFTKGVFQSMQSTGELAFRGVGDIDVVVPEEDFDAAVDALIAQGASHEEMTTHAILSERLSKVHHAASLFIGGVHVDLHRRLDPNPRLMSAPFVELWKRRDTVDVHGHSFDTLSPVDACVYVASHGSQDNWPHLRGVLDLVTALRRVGNYEEVVDRAQRLGVGHRLEIGVEFARVVAPGLPRQNPYAHMMARWAWSRHRLGRAVRGSNAPRDVVATFAYWLLSEPTTASLHFGARRLAWLPSTIESGWLPDQLWWAYPLLAPVHVTRRVLERSRRNVRHREDVA